MKTAKDIRILTLHFYDNYGSVLQAWALRESIDRLLGCRAEIVPFRPAGIPNHIYFTDSKLCERFCSRQALFAAFRREQLGIREPDGGEEILQGLESDAYIVGSDIVWSREHSGLHPAYFLDFIKPNAKRIAYAASQLLRPEDEAVAVRFLPRFDAVSVREAADIPLISRRACMPVRTVLDPTLLLTQEDYAPLENAPENLTNKPYLLFYSLTHDPAAVDAANLLARRFDLRLVHYLADYPPSVFPKGATCFAFCGPREFLTYVKHANLVFTNSYHGTIFSILYRRPFYTQVTRGGLSARVMELTSLLGLENRRWNGWTKLRETTLEQDWTDVEAKIDLLRAQSMKFLRDALDG